MESKSKLANTVSEDGYYTIPVEWGVYSTIRVKADNLQQAVKIAKEKEEVLPLCSNPEYIDGSYRINIDSEEDAIAAQEYKSIGDVFIEENGKIEGGCYL